MTRLPLTQAQCAALTWELDARNPLIGPPWPSPVIADPTVLPPEETPDQRWHLIAHSLLGIHHFVSDDGVDWDSRRTLRRNALRAHLTRISEGEYALLMEKPRLMVPIGPLPWRSVIQSQQSHDLSTWTRPVTVLEPSLAWHHEPGRGSAVGNPCLIRVEEGWRLYYSAGLVFLEDCGFCEPRWIGLAEAPALTGPWVPRPEPLLGTDSVATLGAGAIKVYPVLDGYVGLQNAITIDDAGGSGSLIRLLVSDDGIDWVAPDLPPIVRPGMAPWMNSHVYALDVAVHEGSVFLYFNARDDWHWRRGREHIGRAAARLPG